MLSSKSFFSKQVNRSEEITIHIFLAQSEKKSKILGVFQKNIAQTVLLDSWEVGKENIKFLLLNVSEISSYFRELFRKNCLTGFFGTLKWNTYNIRQKICPTPEKS